jgi:type IV pilus assembly protein PilN
MINLLPWRAQLRRKQRQQLISLLVATHLTTALLLGLSHGWLANSIKTAEHAHQQLQTQKTHLEKIIADYQNQQQRYLPVIAGILLLQRCQTTQANLLQLLQTFGNNIPNSIYLTELTKTSQQLTLTGIARNQQNIGELMQNLETTNWVKQALLLQNQQLTSAHEVHFKIGVTVRQ